MQLISYGEDCYKAAQANWWATSKQSKLQVLHTKWV